jgi:hypothetical protein
MQFGINSSLKTNKNNNNKTKKQIKITIIKRKKK